MNLQQSRNLLIAGESGSGKTTMLQTILYYVVTRYSPEDVNFYILDFSSRNLRVFKETPHCGAFLTDENEDKIDSLFALVREIIDERRKLFAKAEVSSFEAYREDVGPLPLILFVIDNVSQFEEFEGGYQRNNTLGELMRGGVGYGIKTIFTISQINDCPMRLRREAGNKIALRARDRYAYSDILDCRCRYEPVDTPGRGICVIDDECYEFQTALATETANEKQRISYIRKELKKVKGSNEGVKKLESETETHEVATDGEYETFCESFPLERIPLGYIADEKQFGGEKKNIALPLQQLHNISVYFGNNSGVLPIVQNLEYAFQREKAQIILVRRPSQSVFSEANGYVKDANNQKNITVLESSSDDICKLMDILRPIGKANTALQDKYCQSHDIRDKNEASSVRQWRKFVRENSRPVMVLFESLYDTLLTLDAATAARLTNYFPAVLGLNIYFWGLFYPDDEERVEKALYPNGKGKDIQDNEKQDLLNWRIDMTNAIENLKVMFNPEELCLLFGGQFHKQNVVAHLPDEWAFIRNPCAPENVNQMLLHYHTKIKRLVMPCGNLVDVLGELDDQEII